MSSSTHPIILYDFDIDDVFSSTNIPNYASASPNYSPTLLGNTFSSTSEHPSEDQLVPIVVSPFFNDLYMKKQARFLSHSSADFAAPPQIFEIGESSHKTPLEQHEEQIEAILNHLDKLPLRCIEEMEDKIRGLGNGRKQMGHDDEAVLAHVKISTLEMFIEDIQVHHRSDIRSLLDAIRELKNNKITMDLLPPGFLEPLYPGFMNVVHNQDIEHMIPPTSPRDTETPIRSPMPLSSSSSPVRSTTPPPDYPFYESIFTELDNLLWIIPRPLGSEPISKEHNESDTMTQAAIRKLVCWELCFPDLVLLFIIVSLRVDLDLSILAITLNRLIYPMERENDIHEEESNNPPPPQTQIPHTMSHIKLPILKKGNGSVKIATDANGQIKVLPPKTVKEIRAREREGKARTTLLMALPEDHLAKFHKMTDAKEMWEAIKSRFGRNDESKKMQKYMLKKQFESFSLSNSEGLHKGYNGFQSLLSQLDIHGAGLSTEDANQKFLSALQLDHEDLKQVDEFDLEEIDLKWQVAMISMRMKKFYKKTGRKLQFDAKEPVGFDKTNVKCFNCHKTWHFARECRSKGNQESKRRDSGNIGYKAKENVRTLAKQDEPKALVTIDGDVIDWSSHAEKDIENYAFMAYSTSNSGSDK
ncbi:ribonuclease H-like domain-containing protein [Tanacetum coccineum]